MPMLDTTDTIPGKIISRINPYSSVLEFGCATGRMTQYMKDKLQCKVFIVEIDEPAYNIALQYAEDGYCGDIEQFEWVKKIGKQKFDYIIFADVLEHLKKPEKVLEKSAELLSEGGEIIVSIPNICHFDVLANLYLNRFKYTEIGLLDDTHIHFWGERDLNGFFEEKNLGITVIDAVYLPPYATEQSVERGSLPTDVEEALLKKEKCDLYQFFLVAQKKDWIEKKSIRLEDKIKNDCLPAGSSVHLYWDMGEGYKAGECVIIEPVKVKNGDTLVYRYENIPNGCKKVRFDPALGDFCTVENMSVTSNVGALEFRALNGVLLRDIFVFANTDSQLEIDVPLATEWIEIEANVRKRRDAQSAYFYTLLQNVPSWKYTAEQMNYVKEELEDKKRLLDGKTAELEKSRSDLLKTMSDLISVNNTLADTKISLEKIKIHNLSLVEQVNKKETELKDVNAIIEEQGAALAQLDAQNQQIRNELQQTVDYAHHMENLYHQLVEEHNIVVTSQCWRMTYPLRRFLDLLKRCKFFMLIWKTMRSLKFDGFFATCKKIIKKIFRIKDKGDIIDAKKPFASLAEKIKKFDFVSETYALSSMSRYDKSKGKKVLLVSHELDLTGAPVAIFHFAKILKEAGYCPVVVSPHTGKLAKTFEEENIPTFVCPSIYESDAIKKFAYLFDLIVASTIVSAPVVELFNGTNMPVFWWIHEAEASYTELFEGRMPKLLADNVFVKSGGKHAAKLLKKHRKYYSSEQMLYYVPDFTKEETAKKKDTIKARKDAFLLPPAAQGKKVFAVVGMLEHRKGQDLAVDAVLKLPKEELAKGYFVFVGKPYFKEAYVKITELCEKYPENALYIEELTLDKTRELYGQIDCLMCTSRDDPMPIVVTEALMLSKAVICSENTGSAALISQENAGIVYTDNSVEQLAQCILRVLHDDGIEELKANARTIYDKYFSKQVFKDNIISLMNHIFGKYNGQSKGKIEPIKIKSTSISSLIEVFNARKEKEDYVVLKDTILNWDECDKNKKILLVAQDLSLNSSTTALKCLAEELVNNGDRVAVLASSGGDQVDTFEALGVPVIVYGKLYQDDFINTESHKFDIIVLNSVSTISLASNLSKCGVAVYCWIHELNSGCDANETKKELSKIPQNVRILCDSEETQKQLLSCNSKCKAEIMRYAVTDKKNGYTEQVNDATQVKNTGNNIVSTIKCEEKFEFNGTVSVVIPTYNAGDAFETLLQKLLAQKKVRMIEIVAVDSGSTDKTVEYCKKYGVKLIEIPNKEFSHSYARNLGAKMAKGEILIFMTQDACPIDKYWVHEMINPIASGEAVAVSCKEHCNADIDLYYRCVSENHAKFQGIFFGDKLNVFDSKDDALTLRKKASLNDVSCSIRSDIFGKYLYRFEYAEDLDMGIRLLKDGYAIKLINATSVVHGHNRPAGYYMKRALVEVRAMENIMEESKQPIESSEVIARKIVIGSKMISCLEKLNRAEIKEECETAKFFSVFEKNAQSLLDVDKTKIEKTDFSPSQDALIRWCVDTIKPWAQQSVPNEEEIYHHVIHYVQNILKPFVEKENPESVDVKKQTSIYSCMEKQFCMLAGALLSRADINSAFYQSIVSLTKGV